MVCSSKVPKLWGTHLAASGCQAHGSFCNDAMQLASKKKLSKVSKVTSIAPDILNLPPVFFFTSRPVKPHAF